MVNAMTVPVIIMAGSRSGLKTQILQEEPRTLFTHCYGRSLNLAVADTIKTPLGCTAVLGLVVTVYTYNCTCGSVTDHMLGQSTLLCTSLCRCYYTCELRVINKCVKEMKALFKRGTDQLREYEVHCYYTRSISATQKVAK